MEIEDKVYHYFYKITPLFNEQFYYGIHSTKNLNDGYFGGGIVIRKYVKKYGKEQFKFEILEFFETRELLIQKEKEIVTRELLDDPLCMNITLGGNDKGSSAFVNRLNNDKEFKEEFSKNLSIAQKKRWDNIDPEIKKERAIKFGISLKKRWQDPEYRAKNLPHLFNVDKNYKLISEKAKLRTGDKNSSFGSCWIIHPELGCKRIYKKDLEEHLNQGWIKGRSVSRKFVFKNTGEEFKQIYINNTITSKRIYKKDLQDYLNEGWINGKL